MSETNRVSIGIIEETTWGTCPTSPAFQLLRFTGSPDLGYTPTTVTSDEIRSDRNISQLIETDITAGGTINFELSFDNMDELFEGALFNDFEETSGCYNGDGSTEIEGVTATNDTFTVLSGTNELVAYHICEASGFTNSGNNQDFVVDSVSATTVVAPASPGLTDETAPPTTARLRAIGFAAASAADIQASAAGLTSSTLDFTTIPELEAGRWIKIGGSATGNQFATEANNGWARISAVAANLLTLDIKPTSWAADTAAGKTIYVYFGDKLTNGTTEKSYTICQRFLDHSPVTYAQFVGMEVSTLTLNAAAASLVTGSANFLGKTGSYSNSGESGASYVAVPTGEIMSAVSDVGFLSVDETEVASPNYIMDMTLTINNNLVRNLAIGNLGAINLAAGECNVSGTINVYFGNKSYVDYLLNQTEISLSFVFTDSVNEYAYVIDIPSVKLSTGTPGVPGKNDNVMISCGFQAFYNATLGYSISIQRFWNVPID